MPYCRNCGYEYIEGVASCPDCQMALMPGNRVVCGTCGEEINRSSVFCPHCGILLEWKGEVKPALRCETHPQVGAAGCCVVCGRVLCAVCVVRNQGKLFCDNDEHVKMAFDWIAVIDTGTEYEAAMIRSNLEGAGIQAVVLSQSASVFGTAVGDLGMARVMVPKTQRAEAERILHAMEADRAHGGPLNESAGTEIPEH